MKITVEVTREFCVTAIGHFLVMEGNDAFVGMNMKAKKKKVKEIIKDYLVGWGSSNIDVHDSEIDSHGYSHEANEIYDRYFGLMFKS